MTRQAGGLGVLACIVSHTEQQEEARDSDLGQSMAKVIGILEKLLKETNSHGLVTAYAVLCSSLFGVFRR